jgi:hypothetical protein
LTFCSSFPNPGFSKNAPLCLSPSRKVCDLLQRRVAVNELIKSNYTRCFIAIMLGAAKALPIAIGSANEENWSGVLEYV